MHANEPSTTPANRKGARLTDGKAHTLDHSRRSFLYSLGAAGAGSFLLGRTPVNTLRPSALTQALSLLDNDRILVLLRLKGGNDGLNTFIPVHHYGAYERARPELRIPERETVGFTANLAGHPRLGPLKRLWDEGQMRVVRNVGYPEQSLSHFRSADIWATASDSDTVVPSGVLGRYLEGEFGDFLSNPPEMPPAIQIGGQGNLLFNNSDDFNYAISTNNPNQLYDIVRSGQLHRMDNLPEGSYGEQLGYVRAVANTTFRYAGVLSQAYDAGANDTEYLQDSLGLQLSLVARMLKGGLRTRLFVVELDGFDTHAEQLEKHAELLDSVATNTAAFYEDLARADLDNQVLTMTISEFGRRVGQNGSMGTDHGAAAPVMLFGPGLNGNGVTGGLPDLSRVDGSGNLIHSIDFRRLYATVFSDWLCLPAHVVDDMTGGGFARMPELGLTCQGSVSTSAPAAAAFPFTAYLVGREAVLAYELPGPAQVTIDFFDTAGRRLRTAYSGRRPGGEQTQRLLLDGGHLASGIYVVSIKVNGRRHSRKLGLFH